MNLVPNSYGSLREMNDCHSPADGKFCVRTGLPLSDREGRRKALEDPTHLSDPRGVIEKLRAVAAAKRHGISIVKSHEATRFILPDGTRIGGFMEHRGILGKAMGVRQNLDDLDIAMLAGLVRVNPGKHGGIDARKGLSFAQAELIADDWENDVQAPLRFDMGDGKFKVFIHPTAEGIRAWSRAPK